MARKRPRSALELTSQLNSKRPLSPENLLVKKKKLDGKEGKWTNNHKPHDFLERPSIQSLKGGWKNGRKN